MVVSQSKQAIKSIKRTTQEIDHLIYICDSLIELLDKNTDDWR